MTERLIRFVAVITMLAGVVMLVPTLYAMLKTAGHGLFKIVSSEGEGRGCIRVYDSSSGTLYWYNSKGKCEASFKINKLGEALVVKEY